MPHSDNSNTDYGRTTGWLSLWSLVLGIVSAFVFQLLLPQLFAIILGVMALRRDTHSQPTGRWRAWTGLALGGIYALLAVARLASRAG